MARAAGSSCSSKKVDASSREEPALQSKSGSPLHSVSSISVRGGGGLSRASWRAGWTWRARQDRERRVGVRARPHCRVVSWCQCDSCFDQSQGEWSASCHHVP
eukprot:3905594-Rhodomonas_salina.1